MEWKSQKFVLYSSPEFRWPNICLKRYETIKKDKVKSVLSFILFHR